MFVVFVRAVNCIPLLFSNRAYDTNVFTVVKDGVCTCTRCIRALSKQVMRINYPVRRDLVLSRSDIQLVARMSTFHCTVGQLYINNLCYLTETLINIIRNVIDIILIINIISKIIYIAQHDNVQLMHVYVFNTGLNINF